MDILPIQASAVPCERVFSSSSETITKRRSRIKPDLMEALQMVKFLLKKKRLHFTEGWATDYSNIMDATRQAHEDITPSTLDAILGADENFEELVLGLLSDDEP